MLAGLLGVGGGIIIVPVLFVTFTSLGFDDGVAMKVAVATSLCSIIFTSLSSAFSHYRRGAVDLGLFRAWLIPIGLCVILGTVAGGLVDGRILTLAFAVVALLMAANMYLRRNAKPLAEDFPSQGIKIGSGLFVGFVSSLMGIGGGTLSVPILTAVGYDMRRAVGNRVPDRHPRHDRIRDRRDGCSFHAAAFHRLCQSPDRRCTGAVDHAVCTARRNGTLP